MFGQGESTPCLPAGRFDCLTEPTALQARAMELPALLPCSPQ